MEQEQQDARFVILTQDILSRPDLSSNDKIVLARATGFPELYEAAETTAKLLGMSERSVRRSKQKLVELGYLIEVHNTGHGKKYVADVLLKHKRISSDTMTGQIDRSERTNDARPDKIGHETGQNWSSNRTKLVTENKERLNGEKSSSFDKSKEDGTADGEPLNEEAPKRYGNAEINDLLDLWESETGFHHHSTKAERYAISGLLRQYGSEAMKALIRRVGRATRSRDRFAPQIAKPSQLRGKYEKLTALTMWENRRDIPADNGPNLRKLYETPEEYRQPEPEITATKEELHQHAEDIRARYKGTAYEHIFARRAK